MPSLGVLLSQQRWVVHKVYPWVFCQTSRHKLRHNEINIVVLKRHHLAMSPRKIVYPVVLPLHRQTLTNSTQINTWFVLCIIHQRMECIFTLSIGYSFSWISELKAYWSSPICLLSTSELGLPKVSTRCFTYSWQRSITMYNYGWRRNGYYQKTPLATRISLPKTSAPQNSSTPKM